MKLWYLDFVNECVERSDAIRRDEDGYHIVGHGYVANEHVFTREDEAKRALRKLLEQRLEIIKERLNKLKGVR